MATIPLPALDVRPPAPWQPIDILGQMGKIAQLKAMAQQQQLGQLDIQQKQYEVGQTQAINQAYQQAFTVDPATGVPSFDQNKLGQVLAGGGHGAAIPGIINSFTKMQQGLADVQKTKSENDTSAINAIGNLAYAAHQAGDDPAVLMTGLQAASKLYPSAGPAIQALQANPSLAPSIIQHLMGQSPEVQKQVTAQQVAAARKLAAETEAAHFAATTTPGSPLFAPTPAAVAFGAGQGVPIYQGIQAQQARQAATVAGAEAFARTPAEIQKEQALIPVRVGEQVAAEVGKAQALAPTLDQVINTTSSGNKYADVSKLTGPAAALLKQQAYAAGVPVVGDKDTADTLQQIDLAKANAQSMLNLIGPKLATTAPGRLWMAPANTLQKLAQTDPTMATVGQFRDAAIQSMRAVAGSKGLRMSKDMIDAAMQNVPQLTDTLPVAQQKLKNLNTFLTNAENSHLRQSRQNLVPPTSPAATVPGGAAPATPAAPGTVPPPAPSFNWNALPTVKP